MGVSLADLDQRDIARLRAELCEVIAARFAYPPYFDYRVGAVRVRPIGTARRQEIGSFVQAAILEPIERADLSSPEVRRYLEALFLRYLEVNRDLARGPARRRLSMLRVEVPRAAAEVQRGLVALAAGAPGDFGAPRRVASWVDAPTAGARAAPTWERVQHNTDLLQHALLRHEADVPAAAPAGVTGASPRVAAPPVAGRGAWAGAPMDGTAPIPAIADPLGQSLSPFAGLAAGSQSSLFGGRPNLIVGEQPTGPLPMVGLGTAPSSAAAAPALAPDLLQLYGDYLRDLQPDAPATEWGNTATTPRMPSTPAASTPGWSGGPGPSGATQPSSPEQARTDVHVFSQLRFQLEAYIRLAARSYGVRTQGGDPASVIDALRRSGHVDAADLRIAEGLLALSDRVVARGGGTLDDYRQALMLYLLYHRGRLGA
jgi:hypothetical protein